MVDPRLLHLVERAVGGEALDGGDLLADRFADRERAGADRGAIDVNRAGAALGDAATVLRAGEADLFPDRPQQWRARVYVDVIAFTVDGETDHSPPPFARSLGRGRPTRGIVKTCF
jgi:hypothetical protein